MWAVTSRVEFRTGISVVMAIGGVDVRRPRRNAALGSAATEMLEASFLAHRDEALPFAAVVPLARVH